MTEPEKFYLSKAELRRELNVSQTRYNQLLAAGIIPLPVVLTPGSRPVHIPSDVELTRHRLRNKAAAERGKLEDTRSKSGGKPIKPISEKHLAQAKAARL